jgi:phage recombination protein Bet
MKRRTTMSTALVKLDFDKEQMTVIESQFFPQGASKAEQAYCFSVARELCLNPITKEIFFVNRRQKINDKWINKVEPMVGRDGFLSIAHRTNKFAGIETTATIRDVPQLEGRQWRLKQELVAECSVWRKDSPKPFTVQVAYNEYCQRTTEGIPTRFWAEKPETMLKKVAESQALRKAFNIHGVYSPEELGAGIELANGDIITNAIEADYSSVDNNKTHLSVVKPQQEPPVKQSKRQPAPPPPLPELPDPEPIDDEDDWPEPPGAAEAGQITDDGALNVIDLLEGKHIPYDINIDGDEGTIFASSFNEKELLKSSGFRWSSDQKRWTYKFRN